MMSLLLQEAPARNAFAALHRNWQAALPELIVIVVGTLAVLAARSLARRRLQRPGELATGFDDLVLELVRHTGASFVVFLTLWTAPAIIEVPPGLTGPFHLIATLALLVQLAIWGNAVISWFTRRQMIRSGGHRKVTVTALTALSFAARLLVVVLLLLVALSNLGINVTALLTTLGVAGVAVALALQSVLTDLIGAISIVLNRPFLVGETIRVGDYLGTVEYVGLRTTRIRNLPGEQLFLPNSYLLSNPIHNYSRMERRRVSQLLRLAYGTPPSVLAQLPGQMAQIVRATPDTQFDRAHLNAFGDWGFEYELVWYALTADYTRYMDARQRVNLELLRWLDRSGVQVGAPGRTAAVGPAHAEADEVLGEAYGREPERP